MGTVTVELSDEQLALLNKLAQEENVALNVLLQGIIQRHLAQTPQSNQAELRERALSVIGQFNSPNHDISVHHDEYLAQAFDSPTIFGHKPILNVRNRPGNPLLGIN